jgi:carboxyvinyl-carboxyphosphonate phosphorylmutase
MSKATDRLRDLMAAPGCTSVAPIFDPLSARIAEMVGWQVCKLSGSVGKFANLAVPDGVPITNSSDLVDVCRRITRIADVSLVVDADDGGSPLILRRLIRELEAVGVAAVEVEDNLVPEHFTSDRHANMLSKDVYVSKLEAAVAARREGTLQILGRTAVLSTYPIEEALERIAAYANTGIDALMLPGQGIRGLTPNPRTDITMVQDTAKLPLCVSGLPPELIDDSAWMSRNRIQLRYNGQSPYRMAVKAIHDALTLLKTGYAGDTRDRWASDAILAELVHTKELQDWDKRYSSS